MDKQPGKRVLQAGRPLTQVVAHAAGGGLVLGATGPAGAGLRVLESTNLALPPRLWTPVSTNTFDAESRFQFTTPPLSDSSPRFYRLDAPWP